MSSEANPIVNINWYKDEVPFAATKGEFNEGEYKGYKTSSWIEIEATRDNNGETYTCEDSKTKLKQDHTINVKCK